MPHPDVQMTRDADVLLTDNIMATLGKHLQQGTDVLTFFEWSSQESAPLPAGQPSLKVNRPLSVGCLASVQGPPGV